MKRNEASLVIRWAAVAIIAVTPPLSWSPAAWAATLLVPDDYTTIQAAINAAKSGDTVWVAAASVQTTTADAMTEYGIAHFSVDGEPIAFISLYDHVQQIYLDVQVGEGGADGVAHLGADYIGVSF